MRAAHRIRVAAAGAFLVALTATIGSVARADDDPILGTGQERELRSGGLTRTYRVVPPRVASKYGRALVMVLHGGFGTASGAQHAYGWDAVASFSNAEIVYPEGFGHSWNAGRCCGPAQDRGIDDVAFLTAVIRDAEQRDGIDPKNIFVTGMSNGAIMAYRLACEGPIALSAIGPVAGDLEVPCTSPVAPVSVMVIHGTADQNVPYAGGVGAKAFVKVEHTSVAASLARWRSIDECTEQPTTSRAGTVLRETTVCATGTAIVLVAIDGAGHQWPGALPAAPAAARLLGLDPPSRALDATEALWLFFLGQVASKT
jgi:polyhydroxybutyrate depolymerase